MSSLQEICRRTGLCERLDRSEIAPFLESDETHVRQLAHRCLAVQELLSSVDHLRAVLVETDYADPQDMQRLFALTGLAEDKDTLVESGFAAGGAAASRGADALALEILQVAAMDDIGRGIKWLGDVSHADAVAKIYDAIAARHVPFAPVASARRGDGRLRIGYVVPNLVDDFNAPSQRIQNFAKYHDMNRFDMRVYSSEAFCVRTKNLYFRRQATPPTVQRAPKILRTFEQRGVSFYAAPRDVDLVEAATALGKKILADDLDVVAYESSLACPIECVVADWRPAPVQVNINIGVPMYVDGIDCTTYFMRGNYEREAAYFAARGKRSLFLHGGIDLELDLGEPPAKRDVGVPGDTVILVTVGNRLEERMSADFVRCICDVLKANPRTVHMIIGMGKFVEQKRLFQEAGVLGRVTFTGARNDVRHVVRVADVYVNEFPEGGAQSVMEAMAGGVPAVAMRYSDQHLHCCGAEYVGDEMTLGSRDFDGYIDLVNRLIRDGDFRRDRAEAARRRVEELYSFRGCVERFESLYVELHQEAAAAAA